MCILIERGERAFDYKDGISFFSYGEEESRQIEIRYDLRREGISTIKVEPCIEYFPYTKPMRVTITYKANITYMYI